MTDSTTNTTTTTAAASASAPTPTSSDQPTSAPPASSTTKTTTAPAKPKSKPKRRTRTRRRAAASDNEASGDEAAGNQSDSSASSHSDAGDNDSEDEDDEVANPPSKAGTSKSKSLAFPDVSSITPFGWSKKGAKQEETVSFEDFSAGKTGPSAKGQGLSIKGKAKGKTEPGQKREYTPEETAKYEAQKAKRKEKLKAKKAELRDKKVKDKETPKAAQPESDKPVPEASSSEKPSAPPAPSTKAATSTQPTKGKGKKRTDPAPAAEPAVSELTASTSALKLDDTPAEPSFAPAQPEAEPTPETLARGVELMPDWDSSAPPVIARGQARPLRGTQRDAYAQRVAEDPKFTPRVGQFWTHDQRLYEGGNVGDGYSGLRQMSPFWRGRAVPRGAFRGGFQRGGRGGRGGFFSNGNGRGGIVNGGPPRPVELTEGQEENKSEGEGSSRLAMDREFELAEARDKARSAPKAPETPTTDDNETSREKTEVPAAATVQPPTAPLAERKWGHEGFETLAGPDQFRGRGRGRGGVRGGRGGVHPRGVAHLPFHPATIAAAAAAAKAASAASTPPTPASTSIPSQPAPQVEAKSTPGEDVLTRPTADTLLDSADDSVKIKLPGSAASVVPALSTPPITPSSIPAEAAAPSAPAALEVSHQPQYPTPHSSSPGPVAALQAQMYTGGSSSSPHPASSENGSAGSAPFVPQHPNHFSATGMNSSGEFVPAHMLAQHGRPFYPQQHLQHQQHQHQHQQHQQRPYPAQSPQFYQPQSPYSPGPSYAGPPMGSPQGVFYPGPSNGYPNGHGHGHGRSSPLNPYMVNNHQVGGYFSPASARSTSKVSIRAPKPNDANTANGDAGASDSQANGNGNEGEGGEANVHHGSSPSAGEYYAQHYNPYVQPFVPGHRQEAVYYAPPTMNGQQYASWQGYPEQGYYDSNGSYGY